MCVYIYVYRRYIIYNIKFAARNFEKYIRNYSYINVFSSNLNWIFENLFFLRFETARCALKGNFIALTFDNRAYFTISGLDAIYRPKEVRSSSRASWGEREGERRRNADLFKSLAVELTRVEPRKHTRFSLFSCDRAASRIETGRRDADRSTILPPLASGGAGGDERRRDVDGYVQKITFTTNPGRSGGP